MSKGRANLAISKGNFTEEELRDLQMDVTTMKKHRKANTSYKIQVPTKLLTPDRNKVFSLTKYVLDADIKGCFDNISHEWLLNNVPFPNKFKGLLYNSLKTTIVEPVEPKKQSELSRLSYIKGYL